MSDVPDQNRKADRAGRDYWQSVWADSPLSRTLDPTGSGIRNYLDRRFDRLFERHLVDLPPNSKLIEVGCGNSGWLPYFATRYGFAVSGVDYSPIGCEQSRRILARESIKGDILCADLFHPPSELLGKFEVAVSFGLVEHFADTALAVTAIGRLVRPGGLVITTVPNLAGWLGPLQKLLNRSVYDAHIALTDEGLADAHVRAGLEVLETNYLVPVGLGICNLGVLAGRSSMMRLLRIGLRASTALGWFVDERIWRIPTTKRLSGHAYCVARQNHQSRN